MGIARRGRSRDKLDASVDMTPMLDIVFIMLIFFIVSAVFLNEKGIDFTQSNGGTPPEPTKTINVYVYADGSALLNGLKTEISAVPAWVEILRADRPGVGVSIQGEYGAPLKNIVFLEDQFALADIQTSLKIDPTNYLKHSVKPDSNCN